METLSFIRGGQPLFLKTQGATHVYRSERGKRKKRRFDFIPVQKGNSSAARKEKAVRKDPHDSTDKLKYSSKPLFWLFKCAAEYKLLVLLVQT